MSSNQYMAYDSVTYDKKKSRITEGLERGHDCFLPQPSHFITHNHSRKKRRSEGKRKTFYSNKERME
jgi:hypothetical protein